MNEIKPEPNGISIIDKPSGWTSHDVVAKCRGLLGTKKVGHSGTLDPDATGVLVLGVGRSTRILRYLTSLPKHYVGHIVLGIETTTLDASGEVTATHSMDSVKLDDVRKAALKLTGEIDQIPPMVSALKVGGRRLYEIAREGGEIERQSRKVTVQQFDIDPTDDPLTFKCEVKCSSGTYIRSLAADIGDLLGGGAHLKSLRRLAIGSFTVQEAKPIEQPVLLPPSEGLRDFNKVRVSEEVAVDVSYGRILDRERLGADNGNGPWAVVNHDGDLLAIYEPHKGRVKPSVVLIEAK